MTRVLVVDDDAVLGRALTVNLQARGYDVECLATGRAALAAAAARAPDAVILDLGLPDLDGMEVLAGLRCWTDLPVLVLSARAGQPDTVAALDAGADDMVTKPFGMDELLARLRAALRRASRPTTGGVPVVDAGAFAVDLQARQALVDGAVVRLTPTEWSLLEVLARHPDQVVSHAQLLQDVWGPGCEGQNHYLRVHVAALRRKLEPTPSAPRHLLNDARLGYRLSTRGRDPSAGQGPAPEDDSGRGR